jgi:chaperonin GroES
MATASKSKQKTTIKPLDDRVVIKPTEPEEKTESGIYLPESAQERPMTGTVLAVGPGKLNDDGSRAAPSIKENDTVLYGKFAGSEIELDDEDYVILRESEILGVVE